MKVISGYDITAANYGAKPRTGQICLYTTGGNGIQATDKMLADNPTAVRIAQHPGDTTADVYDVERGAITLSELPELVSEAWHNMATGVRAGQRTPVVYASESLMGDVSIALQKVAHPDTGLFVAHWGITPAEAAARIGNSVGRYLIDGFQYANMQYYDLDMFSMAWLESAHAYSHSWTSHGQKWSMNELAAKLHIAASDLKPGNAEAVLAMRKPDYLIPVGAHFTYKRMP